MILIAGWGQSVGLVIISACVSLVICQTLWAGSTVSRTAVQVTLTATSALRSPMLHVNLDSVNVTVLMVGIYFQLIRRAR